MKKHYDITITGRVQRVGFRFYVMQNAYKHSITGTVRNNDYDKVFIEAEGEENHLNDFLVWCHKGSPGSIIKEVVFTEGDLKNYDNFDVIRGQ